MSAPVVKVTEVVGCLFESDGGGLYLSDGSALVPAEDMFPEAAHVPENGSNGKRGRFVVTVAFVEE